MTENIRERFIVTADDYGIRQTAEPILRLAHEGKIDRVAVLIHYVSAEQAEALKATGVKIDLHLELIGLLKSGEKMHESVLVRSVNFIFRRIAGLATAKKVEQEWRDQIVRFRDIFGRLPDGLNSHEHLHCFPPFFRVFTKLAEEYRISYIRFGKKGMLTGLHGAFIGEILAFFWKRTHPAYVKTALATSDYLVSLDWLADFKSFSERLPSGSIELVVHLEREEDYRIILEYF
ncbi:MAG: ChbG/HpnK family deacetylase [Patescibacteria group bacterium]